MHDTFDAVGTAGLGTRWPAASAWLHTWMKRVRHHAPILIFVFLPTLLAALWLFLVSADQYESDADFVVKSTNQINERGTASGLSQLLGGGGGLSASQSESLDVGDYLTSHDAVATLGKRLNLIAIFRRPEADIFARLWWSDPMAEDLLKYYHGQVDVTFNQDTGITSLRVRAFRPGDAYSIAQMLLHLGESRVNDINQRAFHSGLAVASQQLRDAETALAASQSKLTKFRQSGGDIDPVRSSTAEITLVSGLRGQLAEAKANLETMRRAVAPDSPQFVAQLAKVRGLQSQVNNEAGRLTGGSNAMAPGLSDFEELRYRQDFASKRYEAAATSFESAREQLLRQQFFVLRVVEPNMPQKSLYPKRLEILATVFFGLLLSYGIGWLVLAGVKEHAS